MIPLDTDAIATVRRMVDAGLTHPTIGSALGHPEWRIAAFCSEHQIRSHRGRKLPAWADLELELASAGQGAVAARYGVSTSAISQARRKARRDAAVAQA